MRALPARGFTVLAALAALLVVVPPAISPAWSETATTGSPERPEVSVTLVSGDQVHLTPRPGGRTIARIDPADWPGRRVSFQQFRSGGDLFVIPSDLEPLVGRLLDPSLFNVSALAETTRDAEALPLIVESEKSERPATAAAQLPTDTGRTLNSIDAVSADLPKSRATELGRAFAEAATALKTGQSTPKQFASVSKVWLDAQVRAARLDWNLRQINAPDAWRSGLAGKGVRVAVLDTGVDTTHPALKGKVVAQANFTSSDTVADRNGHGTHVASTAVGNAGVTRERRGVAFGAALLNGKVLDDSGSGSQSEIIAGMEWAVAHEADVVNLSFGSSIRSDGSDPLSQAVDRLSGASDTLFVAASGNTGPAHVTIGSPGSASSALTVGATNARGEVASFSSRGPRYGDRALKPEIAAPGADIVAARAAGTSLGTVIDERFTRASGTSMAGPHVAGAAAALLGHNPEWDGERLKAALVSSADFRDGANVYEQGGGELDLRRALRQPLRVDDATVDFRTLRFPQGDSPQTRSVTVTNDGSHRLRVDLSLRAAGEAADLAEGAVTADPDNLSLRPDESAQVEVTLQPEAMPPGRFSGLLVADPAGHGTSMTVPIGAYVEPPSHQLRVKAVDRNGEPESYGLATVFNVGDLTKTPSPLPFAPGLVQLDEDGQATIRVVAGRYSVNQFIRNQNEEGELTGTFTIEPSVDVDGDTTVTLDARDGEPASAEVDGANTNPVATIVGFSRVDPEGRVAGSDTLPSSYYAEHDTLFIQPTDPVDVGSMEARTSWRLSTTEGPAAMYNLLYVEDSFKPRRNTVNAGNPDLARVRTDYNALGSPGAYQESASYFTDLRDLGSSRAVDLQAPVRRTDVFRPDPPGVTWAQCVRSLAGSNCTQRTDTAHDAGERREGSWLRAPLHPQLDARIDGDTLAVEVSDLASTPGRTNRFSPAEGATLAVWRDGDLLGRQDGDGPPGGTYALGHGRTRIRVERTATMDRQVLPLSTRIEASWVFHARSRPNGGDAVPPALTLDLSSPDVDPLGKLPEGGAATLTVQVGHLQGAADRRISELRVWASGDGGDWTSLRPQSTRDGRWRAAIPAAVLDGDEAVSVRVRAADNQGNRVTQTVHRAFLVGTR